MAEADILPAAIMGMLPSSEGVAPLAAVARALSGFNREQLGSAIEVLIALLDVADPEPDLEENDLEDSFVLSPSAQHSGTGAGCQISDPGGTDEDANGDPAWAEWHTVPNSTRRAGKLLALDHEDAEDDDPDTGVEDNPLGIDPEEDIGIEDQRELDEAENGRTPDWGIDQTHALPDAMVIASDQAGVAEHRKRIRATRCDSFSRWGHTHYRLRDRQPERSPIR